MTDKLLAFIRGIVRPVATLTVVFVLAWGFIEVLSSKPLPGEIYVGIISAFLGITGTVIGVWFGGRNASKS